MAVVAVDEDCRKPVLEFDVTKWPDIHHPELSQPEQGGLAGMFCFVPAAHKWPGGVFSGGDEFWYYTRPVCVGRCFLFFRFFLSFSLLHSETERGPERSCRINTRGS